MPDVDISKIKRPDWMPVTDSEWKDLLASSEKIPPLEKILSGAADRALSIARGIEWTGSTRYYGDTTDHVAGWGGWIIGASLAVGGVAFPLISWGYGTAIVGSMAFIGGAVLLGATGDVVSPTLSRLLTKPAAWMASKVAGLHKSSVDRRQEPSVSFVLKHGKEQSGEISSLLNHAIEETKGEPSFKSERLAYMAVLDAISKGMATVVERERIAYQQSPEAAEHNRSLRLAEEERTRLRRAKVEASIRAAIPEGLEPMPGAAADTMSRLESLGASGSDGIAALALAREMLKTMGLNPESIETKRIIEKNIPLLLDTFEAVPANERTTPFGDGSETPVQSLERGLSAAFERIQGIRRIHVDNLKARLAIEATVVESAARLETLPQRLDSSEPVQEPRARIAIPSPR